VATPGPFSQAGRGGLRIVFFLCVCDIIGLFSVNSVHSAPPLPPASTCNQRTSANQPVTNITMIGAREISKKQNDVNDDDDDDDDDDDAIITYLM